MEDTTLLAPTLHVEVAVKPQAHAQTNLQQLREHVKDFLHDNHQTLTIGHDVMAWNDMPNGELVDLIEIAGYTGPPVPDGFYNLTDLTLDVQVYALKAEYRPHARRRSIEQDGEGQTRIRNLALPNVMLKDEWNSLVFDDALPARLLRYLTRMVSLMKQPGLNLGAFNWNRLCLLHGPPGSGKSTLCRALAQKLAIRLGDAFTQTVLIEINTNAMLSKFFGESGKLIDTTFQQIQDVSTDEGILVSVVMDEVETIAGSRERSTSGNDCSDGLRATNQLLTALDRLRHRPNVIVLCTSNFLGAIDQAFIDRVDIKQYIPSPSPAAIYNIFRSCLNELLRSNLIDKASAKIAVPTADTIHVAPKRPAAADKASTTSKRAKRHKTPESSSSTTAQEPWTLLSSSEVPTFSEMQSRYVSQPQSPGRRVWALAQRCEGLSGRTLRRLPILGLAMYTWGGQSSLDDAVSALESAVEQELKATQMKTEPA